MKLLKIIILGLLLVFAFLIGVIVNDLPVITLDTKVRLFEPLTFLLTVMIGLIIPFFIKRWMEDSRHIKNSLIEELKDMLKSVEKIRDKIKQCYHQKSILKASKDEINEMFEEADLKYSALEEMMTFAFEKECREIKSAIYAEYLAYWKLTTGAEIMASKFKMVNDTFYKNHNETFSKFERSIKKAIYAVHRI